MADVPKAINQEKNLLDVFRLSSVTGMVVFLKIFHTLKYFIFETYNDVSNSMLIQSRNIFPPNL